MRIKKSVQGQIIILELVKIADYSKYRLYQINKIEGKEVIPLYKECFSDVDISNIVARGKVISEVEYI